jgi:hypothetical protein
MRIKSVFAVAIVAVLVAAIFATTVSAQRRFGRRGGFDSRRNENITRDIFPGNCFTFARLEYSSARGYGRGFGRGGRGGGGWRTDYPASDQNFSQRLSELTTIKVKRDASGQIQHTTVNLLEDRLFNYPFLYTLEVASLSFSEEEVERLREYLLRGGFLLVDDFWGDRAWWNWEYEISKVFPPEEYPIVDIPLTHPIFHCVFNLDEVPQIPSVNHYYEWQNTGISYESHDYDVTGDPSAHCRGIFDKKGRLMVVAMHNTDLGDGWEREGENEGYFRDFSVKRAYPMGINIVVYAMTH